MSDVVSLLVIDEFHDICSKKSSMNCSESPMSVLKGLTCTGIEDNKKAEECTCNEMIVISTTID